MTPNVPPRTLTYSISAPLEGATVLHVLRGTMGLSTTLVNRAKTITGGILLDQQPVTVKTTVTKGQILSILVGDTVVDNPLPPIYHPLDIVYEDPDLLVVNKESGIVVHPTMTHHTNTLGHFLSHYYQSTGQVVAFRPVHRLDKGTSGLLCIAKHPYAQEQLKGQLANKTMCRTYVALCQGVLQSEGWQTISAPITLAPQSILKRQVDASGAPAVTHYRVLQVLPSGTLVEVTLETGRTHQIRVHLSHIGHPIMGDFLYGKEDSAIGRTALHAKTLSFFHPITGLPITCHAPIPHDMAQLL